MDDALAARPRGHAIPSALPGNHVDLAGAEQVAAEIAGTGTPANAISLDVRRMDAWEQALATLPADWSDLLAEIELLASDNVEQAALNLAPINPRRHGAGAVLRFRSARRAGYGGSPQMVARCLERCDESGIHGSVRIVRALSDTRHTQTQGPVWLLDGRTV